MMKLLSPSTWALAGVLASNRALGFQFPDCVNGPLANNTVCDTTASPPERAAALVKALNITEKLANLVDASKGAPRLGLPPYEWWSEGLHGVAMSPGVSFNFTGTAFSSATSFANPITLSAAFDDDLVHKVAEVISTEARAFANNGHAGLDFWTPNINPYKDPRWGRGSETPGEDPVRIKGYIKALLDGLEGNEAIKKVIATCKHYASYDLERWNGTTRHMFNAVVSLQDLSEYYLPPFQQCARDSNVGSIMCSYNAVNGTPACASTYLMDDILRKHWGWTEHNNYITSDCNAVQDFLPSHHNFSQTAAQAAAVAYTAGTDTVCEVSGYPPFTDVVGAYNQTLLSEVVIDQALRRLYEGLVRVGYFDPASATPYRSIGWSQVNTPEAQALALQSAEDGLVLLKNDGTLPLKVEGKTVALIGHWANGTRTLLGGYSGISPFVHSPVYAAGQLNLTYHYASGPVAPSNTTQDTWTAPALSAASQADVILYFGGTDQSVASEDKDRDSIAWPAAQLALIETLAGLGKPLVVAQLGDQVDDTPLLRNANVSAILWAGYPGQDGGTAVLRALTGLSAPAGRLPVTQYPAAYVDEVPMTDMSLRPDAATGNPGRTYRWYNASLSSSGGAAAVLPFGYGLHYTTFSARFAVNGASPPPNPPAGPPIPPSSGCSGSRTKPSSPPPPPPPHPSSSVVPPSPPPPPNNNTTPITIKTTTSSLLASCPHPRSRLDLCPFPLPLPLHVTNTGNTTTSDYVALLFAAGTYGPAPYPLKTLVGYTRLRGIKPGETRVVDVGGLVKVGELGRVDGRGWRVLFPGRYRFLVDVGVGLEGGDGEGVNKGVREGEGVDEVVVEVGGEAVVLDEFPQPS